MVDYDIDITVDSEELEKNLKVIDKAIYDGAIRGARDLAGQSLEKYKENISVGLGLHGLGGHTPEKQSISAGALSVVETERDFGGVTVDVCQVSLAGKMMEFEKSPFKLGASIRGKQFIPDKPKSNSASGLGGAPDRGFWWIKNVYAKTHPDYKGGPVMLKDSRVSGSKPFKPMEKTFNEFTLVKGCEVVAKNVYGEIVKDLPGIEEL